MRAFFNSSRINIPTVRESEREVPGQDDTYLIHARDRDFAQHANRRQRVPDIRVIGGSRPGLTKDSREIRRNRGSFMEPRLCVESR